MRMTRYLKKNVLMQGSANVVKVMLKVIILFNKIAEQIPNIFYMSTLDVFNIVLSSVTYTFLYRFELSG